MKGRPLPDLSGQTFGRLLVLSPTAKGKKGKARFVCRCICGQMKIAAGADLRHKNVSSCGCLQREARRRNAMLGVKKIRSIGQPKLIKQGTAFRKFLGEYRYAAKSRGIQFLLSEEQFRALTSLACFYCGELPSRKRRSSWPGEICVFNGVDRKDNAGPYDHENSVPCCWPCNNMKNNMSLSEFAARTAAISDKLREHFRREKIHS